MPLTCECNDYITQNLLANIYYHWPTPAHCVTPDLCNGFLQLRPLQNLSEKRSLFFSSCSRHPALSSVHPVSPRATSTADWAASVRVQRTPPPPLVALLLPPTPQLRSPSYGLGPILEQIQVQHRTVMAEETNIQCRYILSSNQNQSSQQVMKPWSITGLLVNKGTPSI